MPAADRTAKVPAARTREEVERLMRDFDRRHAPRTPEGWEPLPPPREPDRDATEVRRGDGGEPELADRVLDILFRPFADPAGERPME